MRDELSVDDGLADFVLIGGLRRGRSEAHKVAHGVIAQCHWFSRSRWSLQRSVECLAVEAPKASGSAQKITVSLSLGAPNPAQDRGNARRMAGHEWLTRDRHARAAPPPIRERMSLTMRSRLSGSGTLSLSMTSVVPSSIWASR